MFKKARSGRDAFTFSLHGMTTIASFTLAPAVADDRIRKAPSDRRDRSGSRARRAILRVEDFLASYFAPGCAQVPQA
ncbi:MAG TPA: hypothetical protein VLS87_08300 [Woeseiaceae bacterium]|nr:hypothetical protein [Woeseiaceae bacterium]